MRIKLHRPIKDQGCNRQESENGKVVAIVQAEVEPEPLPPAGKAVEIDLGVNYFCVDSDGIAFENPRFIDRTLEKNKTPSETAIKKAERIEETRESQN